MKLLGTFCYNPQAVFPIYFVMRVNKTPLKTGYWKKQRPMTGVEAEWDPDNGKLPQRDDVCCSFQRDGVGGQQIR